VKAGGGHVMTIGDVSTHFLTKLEWYSTLFPRIPVPIQKQIEQNLLAHKAARLRTTGAVAQGRGEPNRSGQQDNRYSHASCCGQYLFTFPTVVKTVEFGMVSAQLKRQLLEILEICWNLKSLLEILEIWNLIAPPVNFCKIDR